MKEFRNSLNSRLVGPHRACLDGLVKKNFLVPAAFRTRDRPVHSLVTIPTASQLQIFHGIDFQSTLRSVHEAGTGVLVIRVRTWTPELQFVSWHDSPSLLLMLRCELIHSTVSIHAGCLLGDMSRSGDARSRFPQQVHPHHSYFYFPGNIMADYI